jgi:D-3-phosphoglycerate dehydrogenase
MAERVVVTDHAFPGLDHERRAAERAGAEFSDHQVRTEDDAVAVTRGAAVALVNFAPVTRRVLEGLAPHATVIRYGVGYDNIDVDAAGELGVRVANVPDYGTATVADHAAALLLALLRRVPRYDRAVRESGWVAPADVGDVPALESATVGLIGTGRIGLALADRLRPFGPALLAFDPYAEERALREHGVEPVALEDLLPAVDGLSLHAPATPETHHVIDADALAQLKPGAVIVNTARGALVDEAALHDALERGALAGAALDVFEEEPLREDSPLRRHPAVLLTPHVAFYSDRSVDDLQRLAAEEAARALAGEPLRCQVNRGG